MSSVVFLFLAHLGVGIAVSLLLVPKDAGVKFFRFNAGLAAALIAAALTFRPGAVASRVIVTSQASLIALGISLACLTIYWIIAGRVLAKLRPVLAAAAAVAGIVAAALHGLNAAAGDVSGPLLTMLSSIASVGLLGGACTAMVLGHWYLVLPSMQVRYLQRIVLYHIVTLVCRVALFAVVLWMAYSEPLITGVTARRYITSIDGIFFWQRVLFGLAAPSVLAVLTWETAKIRSTQSATGILYVDFFTVVVGEILAGYILLSTGLAA